MSTATHLATQATVRALLSLTARTWRVADEMGCLGDASGAVVPVPVRVRTPSPRHAPRGRAAGTLRAVTGNDVTGEQWPYWPTYPGLAAGWR